MIKNNKKYIKKIIIFSTTILLSIALIADIFIGNYLLNYAIGRNGDGDNRNVELVVQVYSSDAEKIINENKKKQDEINFKFKQDNIPDEITIKSNDNLNLKGYYYGQNNTTNRWVIVIHGYRSNHENSLWNIIEYVNAGYKVLAPDLRGCGNSEGEYIGMGWLDKDDILLWIDKIIEIDPESEIILHGVSMGAATVMMTAGENTKSNVKLFIEDCGYTSVWDIFKSELKLRFNLPTFPILDTANLLSNLKAKYDFKETSSIEQLKNCDKPMLFIHGTADDFIPFEMVEELYKAKQGKNKDKLIVKDAGHAESYYLIQDEYWEKVFEFIDLYLK